MVDTPAETHLLRWIVLLPLATAAIHGVLLGVVRRPLARGTVIALSCGSVALSFALSFAALLELLGLPAGSRVLVDEWFPWIGAGRFSAEVSFLLDPLSAVMILIVTGVGSLIHVYSIGYMDDDHRDDKGFQRFFCYLNLFTFSMLVLVLADNLPLLFLGWEGVGLCSYLLIGFWYGDPYNAYCGMKAFVVNRIGDFGFLLGLFVLFWALADAGSPTVVIREIERSFGLIADQSVTLPDGLGFLPGAPDWKLATVVGLLLFVGAAGKSAQIPLYVWLPDAMAGPTPVSALIHAATMVTAGVYMVCRMSFLYAAAPGASAVVAWTGAATALFAATIAITQTDIKKVLAYSTVSQLGYMFLAAGCGGYAASIFHLGTHAFFKALLFLGAGAVILACHHEQDTEKMGGLRRLIPRTHLVFGIGVLAIAGFPPLSGFFSKDEILLSVFAANEIPGHVWLYRIGLATAGLTAFYMFRLYFRTFTGTYRGSKETRSHIEDPAPTVLVPLYVLAFLSAIAGLLTPPQAYGDWFGIEGSHSLANFLAPALPGGVSEHGISHSTEYQLALAAVAAAGLGAFAAFLAYVRVPSLPGRAAAALAPVYRLLKGKYFVDELYDAVLVRPLVAVSDAFLYRGIDAGVIDGGAVNGAARVVRTLTSDVLRHLQSGLAQAYLLLMIAGTLAVLVYLVG